MTLGGCLRMWLALLLMEVAFTLTVVPPQKLQALVLTELADSRTFLGKADTDRVITAANESYTAVAAAVASFAPEQREPTSATEARAQESVARATSAVGERARGVAYLALFRLHWMGEAVLPLAFIAVAAAIDGLVVRRRRAYTFSSTSTSAYSAATYLVLSASLLPLLYLVAPVPVPSVLLPVAGLAFAGAVWMFFAHLPGAGSIMGLRR